MKFTKERGGVIWIEEGDLGAGVLASIIHTPNNPATWENTFIYNVLNSIFWL